MNHGIRKTVFSLLLSLSVTAFADFNPTPISVWVNEVIVDSYSYNYKNYLDEQKKLAHYFTAKGWQNYSQALLASKILDQVKKNNYYVSAVALMPPKIKALDKTNWQADMPVLVLYENPQYQQKQTLNVHITFSQDKNGVRGLAVTSLQTTEIEAPCICEKKTPQEKKE